MCPFPWFSTGGLQPAHAFSVNKITVFTPSQQEKGLIPTGTAAAENNSTAPPGIVTSASTEQVENCGLPARVRDVPLKTLKEKSGTFSASGSCRTQPLVTEEDKRV